MVRRFALQTCRLSDFCGCQCFVFAASPEATTQSGRSPRRALRENGIGRHGSSMGTRELHLRAEEHGAREPFFDHASIPNASVKRRWHGRVHVDQRVVVEALQRRGKKSVERRYEPHLGDETTPSAKRGSCMLPRTTSKQVPQRCTQQLREPLRYNSEPHGDKVQSPSQHNAGSRASQCGHGPRDSSNEHREVHVESQTASSSFQKNLALGGYASSLLW